MKKVMLFVALIAPLAIGCQPQAAKTESGTKTETPAPSGDTPPADGAAAPAEGGEAAK